MKAQSAIEYLAVYGWALIALLVALSALYMTGMLKFQTTVTPECMFIPGLECTDFKIFAYPTNQLRVNLTNNLGFRINVTWFRVYNGTGGFGDPPPVALPFVLANGESNELTIQFDIAGPSPISIGNGVGYTYKVNLTYRNCDAPVPPSCSDAPAHSINGRISGIGESA